MRETETTPALLILEDGTEFHGHAIGADGLGCGEVVFNTAMTGYQEILTDPSYGRQLVTLTYPHIGNVGVTPEDMESRAAFCAGLIVRHVPRRYSNWRAAGGLGEFLHQRGVVGIGGVDTRRLTRLLRERGAQRGCIAAGAAADDAAAALAAARAFPGLDGMDVAREVSTQSPYQWDEGCWSWPEGYGAAAAPRFHVVVCDFGVKHNILRHLAARGCRLTVVPAESDAAALLTHKPDGVFLSNGPGDPAACPYAIQTITTLLRHEVPLFGICLGHQLLALACGARTEKMKFGHHGANHPVREEEGGRVLITSQNHGFTVREAGLPAPLRITHRSLFDGTIQGLEVGDKPAFSFQGHPEASPGPSDVGHLFDRFIDLMRARAPRGRDAEA